MRTAQDIINNARFELTTHIITLMRKIDAYLETGSKGLMTDPEESVVLDFAECVYAPSIIVEVDNSYLDIEDTCREVRTLDFIATSDDHDFYVGAGENTEVEADDITTDELLAIAKCLEKTYDGME
jgi:hypothetical protein